MRPVNINRISPVVPVRDVQRTAAFYERHLGFRTAFVTDDGTYSIVARDGQAIHLTCADGDERTLRATANNISFVLTTESIDALWAAVQASDPPTKVRALEMKPWGVREFHILDPDGCLLRFAEAG